MPAVARLISLDEPQDRVARLSRQSNSVVSPMTAGARLISTYNAQEQRKSITPVLPDVPMIRSMPDLLQALRERRDQLHLTHERIDDIAGFPSGYCGKLMASQPIKNLGWLSFGLALDALGVALVMVENPEQIKRAENRWVPRERPRNAAPAAGKGRRHADHRSR